MSKSRMFSFITRCDNPVGGECPFSCVYCWSMGEKGLVNRYDMEKYRGPPRLYEKYFKMRFKSGEFVFLVDMRDLFSPDVPRGMILRILSWVGESPDAWFLLLTKNPWRYLDFVDLIPDNVVLGATIESDRNYPKVSKAPPQSKRLLDMERVHEHFRAHRTFVAVEPILKFDYWNFSDHLMRIEPWKVAVGYDNYGYRLDEPALADTEKLIEYLNHFTQVEIKSLRRAWWE